MLCVDYLFKFMCSKHCVKTVLSQLGDPDCISGDHYLPLIQNRKSTMTCRCGSCFERPFDPLTSDANVSHEYKTPLDWMYAGHITLQFSILKVITNPIFLQKFMFLSIAYVLMTFISMFVSQILPLIFHFREDFYIRPRNFYVEFLSLMIDSCHHLSISLTKHW